VPRGLSVPVPLRRVAGNGIACAGRFFLRRRDRAIGSIIAGCGRPQRIAMRGRPPAEDLAYLTAGYS